MSWRPEGWDNPYIKPVRPGVSWNREVIQAYEAGADAMLEALRLEGKAQQTVWQEIAELIGNTVKRKNEKYNGISVFIPDEEQNENKAKV